MSTPGYNVPEVERTYLRALHIDNIDTIYPGPDKLPPPVNPKIQIEQMKMQTKQAALQVDMQKFAADMMETRRLNSAKILQLEAQAAKLIAEAGGVQTGHEIAAFEAAIGALKAQDESMRHGIELLMKSMEKDNETTDRAGMEGVAATPRNAGTTPSPTQLAK
jgi:predicted  nucleic acid-binding Zn-ribbon protein